MRAWKNAAGEIEAEVVKLGWWVTFEGSRESLFLGAEKPDLRVGQRVTIIIDPTP